MFYGKSEARTDISITKPNIWKGEHFVLSYSLFSAPYAMPVDWLLISRNSYNVKHESFYADDYLPEYTNIECQILDTIIQLGSTQAKIIPKTKTISRGVLLFFNLEILWGLKN